MAYTLKMRGVVIGRSELEHADASARTATGALRPGLGYDLVQPIFRLYAEAVPTPGASPADPEKLARYRAAVDRLALELFDAGGRRVSAESIHVFDYTEERGAGALELEVVTEDPDFWSGHHPCV